MRAWVRARWAGRAALIGALAATTLVPLAVATATPSAAQDDPLGQAQHRVEQARQAADALAPRYFAQLDRYQTLSTEIGDLAQRVDATTARAGALRAIVRRRAVAAYEAGGGGFTVALEAGDVERVSRAQTLLAAMNARDGDALAALHRATDDLTAERDRLRESRTKEQAALDGLTAARQRLDASLRAALADRADVAARLAQQAAREAAARRATVRAAAKPASGPGSGGHGTPVDPPASAPPPGYVPRPGVSPHHDDPFLVCTRARESGGNYGAVNPAGPYLGAYQFLQSTWNIAAQHAGRTDLVGVPVDVASAFDQDEVTWSLYTWQGNGPWGGRC